MSKFDDWLYEIGNRWPCALPNHLSNWKGTGKVRLHDDWPPLLRKLPRSVNSKGPRCPKTGEGYAPWPPRLIRGKGITRWENAGATSILYIPTLEDKVIDHQFYGTKIRAWETNRGHANFKKEIWVHITWEEDSLKPDMYSPSALQRWSPSGYLIMEPRYRAYWKVIKKNEDPFKDTNVTKENKVFFYRDQWRPDHLDIYYNWGPMAGLQMD